MIDYRKRAEHLMAILDIWVHQVRWEREHGALVKWDMALQWLLACPDPNGHDPEPRDKLLHQATWLLNHVAQALNSPRRATHLDAKAQIEAFLSHVAHEAARPVWPKFKVGDKVRIVGLEGSARLKDLERYGALGKTGEIVQPQGVQRDDHYVVRLENGKEGLVHPTEMELA